VRNWRNDAFVRYCEQMRRPLAWLLATLLLLSAADAATPGDAFVHQAGAVLKFEVASSQLALRKTKSDAVLTFAHQVILDYTAAGMKFRQLLADAKLPMPREVLDDSHKALFDTLTHTPPGKPFAKAYVETQAKVLRDDAEFFQAYAERGDNERLKFFAQEMVPMLRGHLEQAEKLRR
jgi:putative membrane protein